MYSTTPESSSPGARRPLSLISPMTRRTLSGMARIRLSLMTGCARGTDSELLRDRDDAEDAAEDAAKRGPSSSSPSAATQAFSSALRGGRFE